MKINWEAISAIGTIIALLAFLFSYFQWFKSQKLKRTELLFSIMDKFVENNDVIHAMEVIDYEEEWYESDFHGSQSKTQEQMDKLFTVMNNLAILANSGFIKKEIKPFEYKLARFLLDNQVQHYLWNLHHFSVSQNIQSSYHDLINYGLVKKYIDKEKFNSSIYFKKYLNF